MVILGSRKRKKTQQFVSSGTWVNPGNVKTGTLRMQGVGGINGSAYLAGIMNHAPLSQATAFASVIALGAFVDDTGSKKTAQEAQWIEAEMDVSGGTNLSVIIGAGGSGYDNDGWATFTWEE